MNYTNSDVLAYWMCIVYYGTPAAGSYTYNVSLAATSCGGTASMEYASTYLAFILVELI